MALSRDERKKVKRFISKLVKHTGENEMILRHELETELPDFIDGMMISRKLKQCN